MEEPQDRIQLFDAAQMGEMINSIADAIVNEFDGETLSKTVIIGIQSAGVPLAKRLADAIFKKTSCKVGTGTLDISMYRDDIGTKKALPLIRETDIPFGIDDGVVILADHVLQTGRSIRAALDAITDFGRPSLIRLAVLLDRKMREFPIAPDYAGKVMEIPRDRRVRTDWLEYGTGDMVYTVPANK